MLQLDFQAEPFALEPIEPHNKFAISGLNSESLTHSVSSNIAKLNNTNTQPVLNNSIEPKALNLDYQVEERLFDSMRLSGTSALLIFADEPSLLEGLKCIILEVEDELHKYHAQDEFRATASDLGLLGAIDVVETLQHVGDTQQAHSKVKRLKRRISEWAVPTYLIINSLNKFLSNTDFSSHDNAVFKQLKSSIENYAQFRNRMIQANLRLVYSVANKFRHLGLPYEDLVQEGNLGLIKAVERFNISKGFRFSTYAHIVISQSIHLAIDKQGSLVRMPFKALREKASVEKTRQMLEQSFGRSPTISELNDHLPDDLEYKATHISNVVEPNASSQQLYSSPLDSELIEQRSPSEQDIITSKLSHSDIIVKALEQLGSREAYIVRLRYGIGLSKEFTLEEISQTIGLSRERVRQLSHNAVEVLSQYFASESAY